MELAGLTAAAADARELGHILPVDDVDDVVDEVGDVHAALLGVGREVHRARGAADRLRRDRELADETTFADFAVRVLAGLARFGRLEHLHAIVAAVAGVEQAVVGEPRAVQRAAEKFRFHIAGLEVVVPGGAVGFAAAVFTDDGVLPVGAEVADVFAGGRIDDQHAAVAVTVGDVHQVGFRIDHHVGRPVRLGRAIHTAVGVVAVGAFRARGANLVDEGAVGLELQDVRIVAEVRRPRILAVKVARLAVAGDVNKIVVIDVDAVLARRPEAAVGLTAFGFQKIRIARAAPGLQQFASGVEHEDRRRRRAAAVDLAVGPRMTERADRFALLVFARGALHAAVLRADRARAVINPDLVVLVDGDTADVADHPMVRQRLRPCGVEHEARRMAFFLDRHAFGKALDGARVFQRFGGGFLGVGGGRERQADAGEQQHAGHLLENFCGHGRAPLLKMTFA